MDGRKAQRPRLRGTSGYDNPTRHATDATVCFPKISQQVEVCSLRHSCQGSCRRGTWQDANLTRNLGISPYFASLRPIRPTQAGMELSHHPPTMISDLVRS
ncbi:conserved hypothetical protein [Ruegeria lacuscaerulensis ITI-1157]|nr:conserved hypothetical protein [Ruegeria lacuscaerulensis ITI-1157]